MQIRYSNFGAHLMQPSELHKVEPSTLLRFARATKRFSQPLVAMGTCIGPNSLTASALTGSSPWRQVTSKTHIFKVRMVKFGMRVRTWDSLHQAKFCFKKSLKGVYPFWANLYQKYQFSRFWGLWAHILKPTMVKVGVRVRTWDTPRA